MDLTVLPAEDLTDDDLEDVDLTEEEAGLLTDEIEVLVLPVRPLRLDDLVVDADDLETDPEPLLDLVIEELLTPALLEDEPIPLLLLELVVDRRGV